MGISSFFPWFHRTFSRYVDYIQPGKARRGIDNVLVDMNGIFHPAAQKTFGYGKYPKPLLAPGAAPTLEQFYAEVGREVDAIVALLPPVKRLVLCVDGVAPVAKQIQQRQRRYRSKVESGFDSNAITPGTQLMLDLCAYVGKYVRKYTGELEVVWSPSSVPGEGEMKLMDFVRFYAGRGESSAVYGLDADIILLSLCATIGKDQTSGQRPESGRDPIQRMYVVRERDMDHALVDVGKVRANLLEKLQWRTRAGARPVDDLLITDFVFMCFLIGNDFLKRAPGVDILTGSIDVIVDAYKAACTAHGHITTADGRFSYAALAAFFAELAADERRLFDTKIRNINQYIPDPLFEKHRLAGFDVDAYKRDYYAAKFPTGTAVGEICRAYVEGLEWVLGYYTRGVPSWRWFYPYNYSPFISDVAAFLAAGTYRPTYYGRTVPYDQLFQLLLVVPPRSMDLLPAPLNTLYLQFPDLFPTEVAVDAGGKRRDYEAEVLLPAIDSPALLAAYRVEVQSVADPQRNAVGESTSMFRKHVEAIEL